MPVSIEREVMPGIKFWVDSSPPSVIIPVTAMRDLTDEQIGQAARALIDEAYYAQALEESERLCGNVEGSGSHEWLLDASSRRIRALLEPFAGRNARIDRALDFFHKADARQAAKQAQARRYAHPRLSPQQVIRREVKAHYEQWFMQIGRRDGFHCQACRATTDLEIDHQIAVANGGANDLEKMQLLCGNCNRSKSDKE
jgi:hypothetical protein